MKCRVECECGALSGEAEVVFDHAHWSVPLLAYSLIGKFVVCKKEPRCTACNRPPLTTGEWRKSEVKA